MSGFICKGATVYLLCGLNKNRPHGLMHLYTWSSIGGAIWEGIRTLKGRALWRKYITEGGICVFIDSPPHCPLTHSSSHTQKGCDPPASCLGPLLPGLPPLEP